MMRPNLPSLATVALGLSILVPAAARATDDMAKIEMLVAQSIRPVMQHYGIPGMAVGIVVHGRRAVFDYGVMSTATGAPVRADTLFEIGSLSKTFTATLAAYAQVGGHLSLSDKASRYVPELRGSHFDTVSLLNLGTHTSGGLPLQVPDEVTNNDQLMAYFRAWTPRYTPGTYRTYANPSIGLLGLIAAASLKADFVTLMQAKLLPGLGLANTYLDVPEARSADYAQGYTRTDVPVRMAPGVLASEAYGIRTTAGDMVRFIEANMGLLGLDETLQRAIADTHTGYYRIGPMIQDLIWEQYPYPVALKDVLDGNSARISADANPATRIDPPLRPQDDVLINKTGSTNGFAAYVAFVPRQKIGIVLLANKNYPIDARVTAAYEILTGLQSDGTAN